MKVDQQKAWCIYCENSFNETSFGPKEHIFPRSLGGKQRLSAEMVCGKCNSSFSKNFELPLFRDSIFGFLRSMYGPGSEGRTELAKEKKSPWVVMTFQNNEKTVRYIGKTTPSASFPENQFVLNDNVGVLLAKNPENVLDDMRTKILNSSNPEILSMETFGIPDFNPCIVVQDDKIFWFVSTQTIEMHLEQIRTWIKDSLPRFKIVESHIVKDTKQRESFAHVKYDNDLLSRLLIKIAMNLSAYRGGHDFMRNSGFDPFREMVLNKNTGANNVIKKSAKSLAEVRLRNPLNKPHHLVCVRSIADGLRFTAQFYCNIDLNKFSQPMDDIEILASEFSLNIPGIPAPNNFDGGVIIQFTEMKSSIDRERFFPSK